ncbi:hypothetical protein A167_02184 [Alcanivorax sp. S71-1-4]|jgi:uncharacterized protein|uniref:TIGR01777 family oxidoreductase n=1 Tax=Alcanivorax sp. S71-1-4 TaxID=1177159 RepID=UPI001358336C|nr:TIGR01777 family oxidoreductase [Alcanivorax sp. S71-1-4]KAF0808974.1 hypothetical protein A167_02184 [Alcanivorax sp. S71-1-4]
MKILMTGGSGFIGRHLSPVLVARGHDLTVLSRSPQRRRPLLPDAVRLVASLDDIPTDDLPDAVINLAGEGIADRRWTARRKRVLLDSRVQTTQALSDWLGRRGSHPQVLISGSAVGFYGDAGSAELTESSPAMRRDFSYLLCDAWEQAARELANRHGTRLCLLRTGVVLGAHDGMLGRLLPAYRLGLGAQLGNGQQWLSWIHIDDMVALILRCLESPAASGIYNAVAPQPVQQARFHRALAAQCRRPGVMRVPALPLKLALGEMSTLLLGGQKVLPERLLAQGFSFRFPEIDAALQDLLGQPA